MAKSALTAPHDADSEVLFSDRCRIGLPPYYPPALRVALFWPELTRSSEEVCFIAFEGHCP